MTATDHSGPTRRRVLQATAGLIGGTLAIDTADRAQASDDGDSEDVRCAEGDAEGDTASDTEDETVRATVERIDAEARMLVLHTYDGREVTGSPDVYDIREGDVVDARLRAGRVVGVTRLETETRERREEMRDQLEGVADR